MKRLQAYEREEREACQPWLTTVWALIFAFGALSDGVGILQHHGTGVRDRDADSWMVLQYVLHRRIRRRVEAKVAAELRDGRLWKCVECD